MPHSRFALSSLLVAALATSSCLIATNEKTVVRGQYVSSETLARIEPGSDPAFVLSTLGSPSSRSEPDADGRTIWRWSYEREERRESAVLLVLASKRETETKGTVFVEFQDERVVRTWQEVARPQQDSGSKE